MSILANDNPYIFDGHCNTRRPCGDLYRYIRATQEDQRKAQERRLRPKSNQVQVDHREVLLRHCALDPVCVGMASQQTLVGLQRVEGQDH